MKTNNECYIFVAEIKWLKDTNFSKICRELRKLLTGCTQNSHGSLSSITITSTITSTSLYFGIVGPIPYSVDSKLYSAAVIILSDIEVVVKECCIVDD